MNKNVYVARMKGISMGVVLYRPGRAQALPIMLEYQHYDYGVAW